MNKKIITTLMLALFPVIALSGCDNKESIKKEQVINDVTQVATAAGLKDVVVTISGKYEEFDRYKLYIDCSNMEELSVNEMFELEESISDVDHAYVCCYTSNGDNYNIFPSVKQISKNGEDYYDDYYNSDTHKSVVEKENEDYNSLSYLNVTDDDTLGEVWAMAQSFVKDKLKSPKSADFPVYSDSRVSITNSGNYYKVTGYVDAKNSFDAEIRVTFSLVMEKSGSKYTLRECNIYE